MVELFIKSRNRLHSAHDLQLWRGSRARPCHRIWSTVPCLLFAIQPDGTKVTFEVTGLFYRGTTWMRSSS